MTLRLLQLRRSPVHLNRVFSVVSKSTDRFISVAYLTRPLFDCLHFIVSLFVPSFTNGDRFYFYLFLVCVSIRKRVYIINGGLVLSVFFWSRFSLGFGAVAQQGAPCLIYFLLQVAQQRWAFVRAKNSRLQLGRARFEKCLITLRQVYTYNFCVWCLVTNLDTVLLALCLIHANCMRICRMSFVYAYPSLLFWLI